MKPETHIFLKALLKQLLSCIYVKMFSSIYMYIVKIEYVFCNYYGLFDPYSPLVMLPHESRFHTK